MEGKKTTTITHSQHLRRKQGNIIGDIEPYNLLQGSVIRRPIANPDLNSSPAFCFFTSKAFPQKIATSPFRSSKHQILVKSNLLQFDLNSKVVLILGYHHPVLNNLAENCTYLYHAEQTLTT